MSPGHAARTARPPPRGGHRARGRRRHSGPHRTRRTARGSGCASPPWEGRDTGWGRSSAPSGPGSLPGRLVRPLGLSASRPPPPALGSAQDAAPRPASRPARLRRTCHLGPGRPDRAPRPGPGLSSAQCRGGAIESPPASPARAARRPASALAAGRHFLPVAAAAGSACRGGRREASRGGRRDSPTLPGRPSASHRAPRRAARGHGSGAPRLRPGRAQVGRGWGLSAGPAAGVRAGWGPGASRRRRHLPAARPLRGRPGTARTPASQKRGVSVCRLRGVLPCALRRLKGAAELGKGAAAPAGWGQRVSGGAERE